MAKPIDDKNLETAALATAIGGGGTLSEQLSALLLTRLKKQQDEDDAELLLKKKAHEAGMQSQVMRREEEMLKQRQCPHTKPYGGSALVGQRLHSHKYIYLCQYCSKEWFDNEVPLNLRIDSKFVGGPNI